MTAAVALSETGNDRIAMGANIDPFTAHQLNITDLTEESRAWLDGKAIESAEEAEGLETLLDMARKAAKAADDARTAEKKPHLEAGKAVDEKWNPLKESANRIADLCKRVLTPWRDKIDAERKAEEARKAAEAEEQRQREVEASRLAVQSGSLEDRERADQEAAAAQQAERVAKQAAKAASGSGGLRIAPRAEITDFAAAARFYWGPEHARFEALVLEFAQRDARAGKRNIPGVTIHLDKKAV